MLLLGEPGGRIYRISSDDFLQMYMNLQSSQNKKLKQCIWNKKQLIHAMKENKAGIQGPGTRCEGSVAGLGCSGTAS